MARLLNPDPMTEESFYLLMSQMANYFRFKTTAYVDEQYYERLKNYPEKAIVNAIENRIKNERPVSSSFPSISALATDCVNWLNENIDIKHALTVYDEYYDYQYPIVYLYKAYDVLERQGTEAFISYVKSMRMPLQDVERVVLKAVHNDVMDKQTGLKFLNNLDAKYKQLGASRAWRDKL